jgi:hypothetical protein
MAKKPRYVVWYEQPRAGRFTVLDIRIHQAVIGDDGKPLTSLSYATAEEEAEKLNASDRGFVD